MNEDLELLKKYDSDEDLYAKFADKSIDSRLWGNVIDQAQWKSCVLDSTNIIDGSLLILFRVILFTYGIWIVIIDH